MELRPHYGPADVADTPDPMTLGADLSGYAPAEIRTPGWTLFFFVEFLTAQDTVIWQAPGGVDLTPFRAYRVDEKSPARSYVRFAPTRYSVPERSLRWYAAPPGRYIVRATSFADVTAPRFRIIVGVCP